MLNHPDPSNAMYKAANQKIGSTRRVLTYRRREPVGCFSLPGKVRNQIMRLIFLPGDIHIRGNKEHGVIARLKRSWKARGHPEIPPVPSLPGFQLPATCKQAYAEGRHMFHHFQYILPASRRGWMRRSSNSSQISRPKIVA